MSKNKKNKKRINFSAGQYFTLPIFDIDIRPDGTIIYAFPYSNDGLHITLPSVHGKPHITNTDKTFYETIDLKLHNNYDMAEYIKNLIYKPNHGEDVIVMSFNIHDYNYSQNINNKIIDVDFLDVLRYIEYCPVYIMNVENIKKYCQSSSLSQHLIIDPTDDSFINYDNNLRVPIKFSDPKKILEMPILKDLMRPMKKAFEYLELEGKSKTDYRNINIPNIDEDIKRYLSKIKFRRFK